MSDKKIGIPEWRGLGVSAALHNEVVQNYSDKVAELESALASERAARIAAEALLHKLMLVVDDDEQIYNKDTDHERLMRAKRLIATHWGLDDFEWEPDE